MGKLSFHNDHGLLTGLSDDDHSQYLLLAGRVGGQVAYGGTGANETLTLEGTSHATKGNVLLAVAGAGKVGVGGAPSFGYLGKLQVLDVDSPAPNLSTYAGLFVNNALGGTTGTVSALYATSAVADVGAGNYSTVAATSSEVYIGRNQVTGAAVAYTGTVTVARGMSGTVQNQSTGAAILSSGYGGIYNVTNTGASSIIRNAYGVLIDTVSATGVDAGQVHAAYGIYLTNLITASGGATNYPYSIFSLSTAPSVMSGKSWWMTSAYPHATDYEGLSLTVAAGTATFAAETLGAGTDNVSIVFNPAGTGSLKWGANTVAVLPLIFTRGGTVANSTGVTTGNYIAWYCPFSCTVTNVRGRRVGGTGATVNARLNGASNHLAAAVSLVNADTWYDGGAVQNTAYVAGDLLEIMVVSVAGAPTQVAIQVDYTRP